MTKTFDSIADVPSTPGVYVMYAGSGRALEAIYVGIASNLKSHLGQHLIRRDSRITTGAGAVSLNPDKICEVHWWKHKRFKSMDYRGAAEVIASQVLNPVLRNRALPTPEARELADDKSFADTMRDLIGGPPAGVVTIDTVETLGRRVAQLERKLRTLESLSPVASSE
jgi:hypothetical protein